MARRSRSIPSKPFSSSRNEDSTLVPSRFDYPVQPRKRLSATLPTAASRPSTTAESIPNHCVLRLPRRCERRLSARAAEQAAPPHTRTSLTPARQSDRCRSCPWSETSAKRSTCPTAYARSGAVNTGVDTSPGIRSIKGTITIPWAVEETTRDRSPWKCSTPTGPPVFSSIAAFASAAARTPGLVTGSAPSSASASTFVTTMDAGGWIIHSFPTLR